MRLGTPKSKPAAARLESRETDSMETDSNSTLAAPETLQPAPSTPAGTPPPALPTLRKLRLDSLHFPTYHVLFPVTIFLSAFLLFQVQPMIGRYILPWFGGGPAVWTSCLLFFQACLLAGYAYAHALGSLGNVRLQAVIHVGLLLGSLAFLPIHPNAAVWKPVSAADPSGRIFLLLTVTVGGPYLLLSATAPLLQRWYVMSESGGGTRRSPWRLYALSNFGSFLALLSYPFVFEPLLRLRTQGSIWSGLYVVFALVCGFTAWRLWSVRPAPLAATSEVESTVRPTAGSVL